MCDRHDLGVALGDNGQGEARLERGLTRLGVGRKGQEQEAISPDYEPNIFIYDSYPGGIGLSEPLYRLHDRLLRESRGLIAACPCKDGCPSCVGPAGEMGSRGKEVALRILDGILRMRRVGPDPAFVLRVLRAFVVFRFGRCPREGRGARHRPGRGSAPHRLHPGPVRARPT